MLCEAKLKRMLIFMLLKVYYFTFHFINHAVYLFFLLLLQNFFHVLSWKKKCI